MNMLPFVFHTSEDIGVETKIACLPLKQDNYLGFNQSKK